MHASDIKQLESRFAGMNELRGRLIEEHGSEFQDFLDWFERWFLRRAEPVEVET